MTTDRPEGPPNIVKSPATEGVQATSSREQLNHFKSQGQTNEKGSQDLVGAGVIPPVQFDGVSDKSKSVPQNPGDPVVTSSNELQGKVITKTWSQGPHAGESEHDLDHGVSIHYKPDGKGGESDEYIDARGRHSFDKAYQDDKGNVIEEHTGEKRRGDNYTATVGRDGSLTVDWKDGRHIEQHVDNEGVTHTKMTGSDPSHNFTATTAKDLTETVKYADGSGYVRQPSGEVQFLGKSANNSEMKDRAYTSAGYLATAYFMTQSQLVHDVQVGPG